MKKPAGVRGRTPRRSGDEAPVAHHSAPVVGIGASAGGLEALGLFLGNVPERSGLAFVIVQHLDPTHEGSLVELLQRTTPMPVAQATDRMAVEADHVYVIPPNRDLAFLSGHLHLLEPVAPRGLRLPIDFFLRSLAEDRREDSIGVILSGMGSDGTLGLRAIKEHAGTAFVQSPQSAKFDGMPRSAVDAGLADVVAPVEELPGRILAFLRHVPRVRGPEEAPSDPDQAALAKVIILLRARTGHDLSLYKKNTLFRRIERRMGIHQLPGIGDYVRYLRANAQECDLLFRELLIGVTSFFRDPPVWEQMVSEVIPELLAGRSEGGTVRAWVPACSTGEEAYSLAIVFREALDEVQPRRDLKLTLFATDLDREAVEKARAGSYPPNIAADVSPERLRRFFSENERGYRVAHEIRELVVFAPHNVVTDPPFTKLDVLSCRNLLIYLEPELQKRLLSTFHYGLNPRGILVLGTSETVGMAPREFTPVTEKARIYRRVEPAEGTPIALPAGAPRWQSSDAQDPARATGRESAAGTLQTLVDRMLLQDHAPAAVLVNERGDIAHVHGKTGRYLEPAAGRANFNLLAMAREGLDHVLPAALRRAVKSGAVVKLDGVGVPASGGTHRVDVTVRPLTHPAGMALVVFQDGGVVADPPAATRGRRAPATDVRCAALEAELARAREEVRITRDENQISQEELQSANEELQSMNEELQSTNEELTTSKEEMQSMNEELQTVNQELLAKLDELSRASADMSNLLNSTDIATLFLDHSLQVRRFTPTVTQVFKLLPGDVGRPLSDLSTELDYPGLFDDARSVLDTLVFREGDVQTRDGRWFKVRIMPYRTHDRRIDGLVVTFTNVTITKKLEHELRATEARLRGMLEAREDKRGEG